MNEHCLLVILECAAVLWGFTAYPQDLTLLISEVLVSRFIYHQKTAEVSWIRVRTSTLKQCRKGNPGTGHISLFLEQV